MNTQQTIQDQASENESPFYNIVGPKAYTRAIRREHNTRSRNACPWCTNTNTVPYSNTSSSTTRPQRLCQNCQFLYTEPEPVHTGAPCHQ